MSKWFNSSLKVGQIQADFGPKKKTNTDLKKTCQIDHL